MSLPITGVGGADTGIGPVTVSGTPTSGQVPTALTGTTASWQTPSGGGISSAMVPIRFSVGTPAVGASATDRAGGSRTLTGARMRAATAPAGSSLIAQVQHSTDDNTYTTIGTLTMTAGSRTEQTASFSQAQSLGHYVRVNVTSVGSTTAATGVVVDVAWS